MSPNNTSVQWTYRSFAEAVGTYSECECRDPKDRVYGLLALPYRTERPPPIEVDYRKSVEQIFEEAVSYMTKELKPFYVEGCLPLRYDLFANAGKGILPGSYLDIMRKIPEARDIVRVIEESETQS
jgi:hypothetical protein